MAKPWGRIELDYINHDKFKALNANAICLWHEGKNYSDVRLTDGLIPSATAKLFRFYSKKAAAFLLVSAGEKPGAGTPYAPLWEVIDGFGFKMHDYLEHNDGRDVVLARIAKADAAKQADADRKAGARAAKEEKRIADEQRRTSDRTDAGHPTGQPPDTGRISERVQEMSGSIQNQNQKEQEKNDPSDRVPAKKPPDPRIKAFLQWFPQEYARRRHGSPYLVAWDIDAPLVKRMLTVVDEPQLKRLAQLLMSPHTNDEFIEKTDRGIRILSSQFNWLCDRLAAWDAAHPRQLEVVS